MSTLSSFHNFIAFDRICNHLKSLNCLQTVIKLRQHLCGGGGESEWTRTGLPAAVCVKICDWEEANDRCLCWTFSTSKLTAVYDTKAHFSLYHMAYCQSGSGNIYTYLLCSSESHTSCFICLQTNWRSTKTTSTRTPLSSALHQNF